MARRSLAPSRTNAFDGTRAFGLRARFCGAFARSRVVTLGGVFGGYIYLGADWSGAEEHDSFLDHPHCCDGWRAVGSVPLGAGIVGLQSHSKDLDRRLSGSPPGANSAYG